MKEYKILNLYACLGGNRYKWDEVAKALGIEIKVTAVELDPELARLYQERFLNDIVIIEDAHQYLLDHYKEFDFIWSSPPCPTHSRVRHSQKNRDNIKPLYPSMILYEEIIFLENHFNGKFVVENVIPYYEPLIIAKKRGRHLYWTNFNLPTNIGERKEGNGLISKAKNEVQALCKFHDYDFNKYNGKQRRDKIARNLVDYEVGKTILETALGIINRENVNQITMF
jgi:DNA (cytosine-5)-methyltransferase 1